MIAKQYRCDHFDKETVHHPISDVRQDFDNAPCICGGTYCIVKEHLDNDPITKVNYIEGSIITSATSFWEKPIEERWLK